MTFYSVVVGLHYLFVIIINKRKPGLVVHICNPSTWEAES
jgi:hypothetical protein